MSNMVNPMDALESYQQEYLNGSISPVQCAIHPHMQVFMDTPEGPSGPQRFTYTLLEERKIIALVILATGQPINRVPCFDVGYAVAMSHRNCGLAKQIVTAAIDEITEGLAQHGILEFYVEAVVGKANHYSQNVAAKVIQQTPSSVTDENSGEPAFRYVRKIQSTATTE